jgi:hypothetical protein
VQGTVDICSIYDARPAKGAEHRNIGTYYSYYFGALHLSSFYQFFYYKYFAALPLSDAKDPTANRFYFRM